MIINKEKRFWHCLGGAILGCYALQRLGYEAYLIGITAIRDDGHEIAVYRIPCTDSKGKIIPGEYRYGAVSKSNYTGLRSRDCVYASVKELIMSYWEHHFNNAAEKSIDTMQRAYDPFCHLDTFKGKKSWLLSDAAFVPEFEEHLGALEEFDVVPKAWRRSKDAKTGWHVLRAPVSKICMQAGLLVADMRGTYQGV